MEEKTCPTCNGSGYNGTESSTVFCTACGGAGSREDRTREPVRKISCERCGGSGKMQGSQRPKKCWKCGGTGKVRKGGDCFITTATMVALGKGDHCEELETFRAFRDIYVLKHFPQEIENYYQQAPTIVKAIDSLPRSQEYYLFLWRNHLSIAYKYILKGSYEDAYQIYKDAMYELENRFLSNR